MFLYKQYDGKYRSFRTLKTENTYLHEVSSVI